MSRIALSCALWVVVAFLFHTVSSAQPSVLYEFVSVRYAWESAQQEQEYIASGQYVNDDCVITGVKQYKGETYVTVPRWRKGVPATLNKIVMVRNTTTGLMEPALQPFPSLSMQTLGDPTNGNNPANIKYTQSMEIDSSGVMWIVGVGRLNFLGGVPSEIYNGPPKLILYDINAGKVLHTFVFPDSVTPYNSTFLNDIFVDQTAGVAYLSDAGAGALVVYNRHTNSARRYEGVSTKANPSTRIVINGHDYSFISTPVDGLALSADRKTLYYCALKGNTMYSLPTAILSDFTLTNDQIHAHVRNHGYKPPSDGMASGADGSIFYGSLTGNGVFRWDPTQPITSAQMIAQNATTMQWVDTFAFNGENLIFSTNRLQDFANRSTDYSGRSGANMRIFQLHVGTKSYLTAQPPPAAPPTCPSTEHGEIRKGVAAGVAVAMFVVGVLVTAGGMYTVNRAAASKPPLRTDDAYMSIE